MSTYSAVIAALIERLQRAATAKGMLAGVRVVEYPVAETDGDQDIPVVRCLAAPLNEQWTPGQPTRAGLSVVFQIATVRTKGLPVLAALAESFMNAIEVTEAGFVDPLLGGLIMEPMAFRTDQLPPTELSLSQTITVTCTPAKLVRRGGR